MRKLFLIFAAVSFWSTGAFAALNLKLPTPELETLPNGLKLAWFVNDHLPVVDLVMLVQSGHRDDPTGKSGTAELVSSLLDRGAAGMNAQQIAKAVEMLGASRFIGADEESFSIGMHGLAPDGDVLLDLLSKLVLQPDFPDAEVAREHARMLDRWNHLADYGENLASLAFRRVMTAGTVYGRGSFASAQEFSKVSRSDVLSYYKKHFTPKNSVLMVVGRVNREEFRKRISQLFGSWQGDAPAPERKTFTDKRLKLAKSQVLIIDRPGLTQAQVRMGFRAPLIQSPDHYALVVTNALLGEYFNSRLNSLIRDKLGLTYGIGSSFNYSKDLGTFTISSATKNDNVGPLVRKAIDVLKDLKRGPIGGEEITMAKEYLTGSFPISTSTLSAVASRWLAGFVFDLGPDYLNEFIPKVSAIERDQVGAAVAKHFPLDQLQIVIAGEAKEIEKSLKAAKFTSIRRVTARDLM